MEVRRYTWARPNNLKVDLNVCSEASLPRFIVARRRWGRSSAASKFGTYRRGITIMMLRSSPRKYEICTKRQLLCKRPGAGVSEQLAEEARRELAEGKTAEQIEKEVDDMSAEEVAR